MALSPYVKSLQSIFSKIFDKNLSQNILNSGLSIISDWEF